MTNVKHRDPWYQQPNTTFAEVRGEDGRRIAEVCAPGGERAARALDAAAAIHRYAVRRWGRGAYLSAVVVTDGDGRLLAGASLRDAASQGGNISTRENPPRPKTLTARVEDPEAAVFGLTATTDASADLLRQLEAQLRPTKERVYLDEKTVRWALERHAGRILPAAQFLQVPRSTLRYAMDRLGIKGEAMGRPTAAAKRAARGRAMDLLEKSRP